MLHSTPQLIIETTTSEIEWLFTVSRASIWYNSETIRDQLDRSLANRSKYVVSYTVCSPATSLLESGLGIGSFFQ